MAKPIPNTPYFLEDRKDGLGVRAFRKEVRVRGSGKDGEERRIILFEVYRHTDGTIFDLPLNDADTGKTLISRMENLTDGTQRNLYHAKGARFASEKDVLDALAVGTRNRAAALEARKLRQPGEAARAQGAAMAANLAPALAQEMTKLGQALRGKGAAG